MPELQMPDIAGNFLSSYYTAQQKQQGDADRQRNMMRQDVADERAGQQFDMQMDLGKLEMAQKKTAAMNEILSTVDPANPASLDMAKQRFVQTFGGDPQAIAHITMADIPRIKMQTGQTAAELDLQYRRAQIAAANRSNRGGAGGGGSGGAVGGAPGATIPEGDGLNPYDGITDPKQRDMMYRQLTADFNARQRDYQKDRTEAQNILASTEEFLALNKKVGSGGVTGSGGLSSVPIVNSARNMVDSDWARMNAITDRLTPLMRQGLPGAASDRDMQTFRGATVGTGKLGEANVGIARGLQVAAKNVIDKGLFDEAYFRRNRHLQGSDNAWNRYLEENPIFDPRSDPANPTLNRSRKSWREYVSPSAPAPQAAAAPAEDDFSDVDALLGLK